MATYTPVRFNNPATLTTSAAAQYTVGAGKTAVSKQFVFNNTSASPVSVSLHVVPSGSSALTSNQVITLLSIAAYSQVIWAADIPLGTGDSLQAFASTGSVVVFVASGIEIQ